MYNRKKTKQAQVASYEKYLRNENLGPKSNDSQRITEAELPHRTGDIDNITESQMKDVQTMPEVENNKIIEKILNDTPSYLSVPHRDVSASLTMPPINVLVEKLRQDRLQDFKDNESKESNHWTLAYDNQNAELPKWSKNAPQIKPEKSDLQNDPGRFKDIKTKDMLKGNNKNKLTPVTASLNRIDVDYIVESIKKGNSLDYDAAIVAILKQADAEKRELSSIEQKTISNLEIARTRAMLPN